MFCAILWVCTQRNWRRKAAAQTREIAVTTPAKSVWRNARTSFAQEHFRSTQFDLQHSDQSPQLSIRRLCLARVQRVSSKEAVQRFQASLKALIRAHLVLGMKLKPTRATSGALGFGAGGTHRCGIWQPSSCERGPDIHSLVTQQKRSKHIQAGDPNESKFLIGRHAHKSRKAPVLLALAPLTGRAQDVL